MIRPDPTRVRFPISFLLVLISALVGCGGGDSDTTGPDASLGSLTVTASTSGSAIDPDGYTVVVDGLGRGTLTGSDPLTISGLAPGDHTVGLDGVATNCLVEGDTPRLVSISSGATVSVAFSVVCSTPPPGTGSIQVVVTTSGPDPDPEGYLATLDGAGPGIAVPATGSATFPGVAVGSHTVALSGLASNCTASAGGSATTTVSSGAISEVSFTVTCAALPPTVGAIRISTSTTGPDSDADGYQFAVDGGAAQSIVSNGQVTVSQVSIGTHTVVLSGVADNCSVTGGATKTVSVAAGQTANAAFSIECSATEPSATRSRMLADPKIIPAGGGSSTITVTVRDANGGLLEGVPVILSASGSGNTITPESATTNASGVATFTFSSVVAGDKTIGATAGGVTLEDTEVISVFQRSSSTQITSIEPEPSTSGQTFTVTVLVTGEGGGTPTGSVAVFSLQETGGCDAAPLDEQGMATCEFALDLVTTHSIHATYSGDGQFEDSADPDGQQHVVTAPATTNLSGSR